MDSFKIPMHPERAIADERIPWVPLADGVAFKPFRFDFSSGVWVNALKVEPGAGLGRHRHNGGPVLAYCLHGSWWYLERDWKALPGTFVYEPPGDIHTLASGPDGKPTLFVTDGVLQFFDGSGGIDHEDNVFTRYEMYMRYCTENGIEVIDLLY